MHQEVLHHRTQRNGGEVGECTDDDHDSDKQTGKKRRIGRESPGTDGDTLLLDHAAGDRQQWHDHQEPAHQHGDALR